MSIMKVMDKDDFVQENMARWADAVDKGWRPIVQEALERIGNLWETNGLALEDLAVLEVKEKFGTLRMYVSYFDAVDDIDNGGDIADSLNMIVDWAESRSSVICEVCGEYGQRRATGYIRCLCEDCYQRMY